MKAESNKMKEMPVNKLMIQMGIPMILSMALQAVYNIVDSAFVGSMKSGSGSDADGCSRNRHRCWNQCPSRIDPWARKLQKGGEGRREQSVFGRGDLCGVPVVWDIWGKNVYFFPDH